MNSDTIRVRPLPIDIRLGEVEANLAAASEKALAASGADILVLPELFSTGYIDSAETMRSLAEPMNGPTMRIVAEISRLAQAAVCGSFCCIDKAGSLHNRAFFVTPEGDLTHYDKRHLFSLSHERSIFSAGREPISIVQFQGWRVAMSVCYDLRFPAWMRNRGYAYDLMLLPANWPQARRYALEHLLIARAIENQAPIVCANRCGSDVFGCYDGCTFGFDQMGRPVLASNGSAIFCLSDIRRARERFPAASDADSYTIDW